MFHQDAIQTIKDSLMKKQQTIAVAESVTSGFLQAAFSTGELASSFFQGGLTAYNLGQKCRHLHINPIHAMACNCVSEKMAIDMAMHISHSFIANWGIGITGYATVVPESHDELFAYFAIVCDGKVMVTKEIKADASKEQGEAVQLFYVNTVLDEMAAVVKQ